MPRYEKHFFINVDSLTYAGNLQNLKSLDRYANYSFVHADINDYQSMSNIFKKNKPDIIVHFAAESHVDRSISGPKKFIETNILGTCHLLELARENWKDFNNKRFHHVGTDEVFGSLDNQGFFNENTPYAPRSPYSASKASSDHLVRAYYHTYGLPITVTNCSNNYGPFQFPEKLIPLMIYNILNNNPLPVYGNGENVRDWLYVEDHCEAIWTILEKGKVGETYLIGGNNEKSNIEVIQTLCEIIHQLTGKPIDHSLSLITYVKDRSGHDYRYAIDATKIKQQLAWKPKETFENGLKKTVEWYLSNPEWIQSILSGNYVDWIKENYSHRLEGVSQK